MFEWPRLQSFKSIESAQRVGTVSDEKFTLNVERSTSRDGKTFNRHHAKCHLKISKMSKMSAFKVSIFIAFTLLLLELCIQYSTVGGWLLEFLAFCLRFGQSYYSKKSDFS